MKVNITGRHVKITDAMREYARDKASKLDRFFDRILHVDVLLEADGQRYLVEMSATLGRHAKVVGKAQGENMLAAIDLAESKVQRQIQKFHDRLKDRRDRRRIGASERPAAEQEEATYEQIVREMLEEEKG
jgi:putative sigma-54 modulation protein